MNNAESKSEQQDHEIAQTKSSFGHHSQQQTDTQTTTTTTELDDQQKSKEHFSHQQNSSETTNESQSSNIDLYTRISTTNLTSGRNKRKNFNPRPTAFDSNLNSNSTMNATSSYTNLNSSIMLTNNISESLKSQPISTASSIIPIASSSLSLDRVDFSESLNLNTVSHKLTQYHPWLQMLNHYEQIVKAGGLKAHQFHQQPSSINNNAHQFGQAPASVVSAPEMSELVSKFDSSESSAIRDILKVYQGKAEWDILHHHQHQDGDGSVNLSTETEPPTPPTTPQTTWHSSSRSGLPNGSTDPPPYQSPDVCKNSEIKEETQNSPSSPSPSHSNLKYTHFSKNHNWNKVSEHRTSDKTDCEVDKDDYHQGRSKSAQSCHDEDSDYERGKGEWEGEGGGDGGPNSHQNVLEWCEDAQKIDKTIKNECDDTETTVDDDENNIYYEEDYPPRSPNDFPDSPNPDDDDDNDDDDDDDSYSLNMFCDDEQSEADDQKTSQHHHHNQRVGIYSTESDDQTVIPNLADISNPDPHSTNLATAEKDSTCSNSSSRISVRNLGGFYEQGQMNLNPSKLRSGIDEKTIHPHFFQNMDKFTSYLDCLNEMCRLENLREHYHCHDYPCYGKILSKKEEVIRHVKWHRKRMESLNHGFMRFSSSDDCSVTFGVHCQHNRKQTHYHCFQPNCDRIYISTSDVQMHSNFHRKDSAIHKEGFQRFRANEKCSADYCMFAGQKTTHFHCRRDNCQYTFKNKADMEKHKTYHIKDLKLARDGFKKFLKNEACPYKQCKFSKVCNHIHCARENCFYVLHSSGQLLSHKRKHERIDNEQTYCRYKMLAVKAALMGNPGATAAATASSSTEMPAFNFSKSLMQLKDLESNSFNPRSSSEASSFLSIPKQEPIFRNKDDESPDASSSVRSIEFLQQMKKRHEEILNQKTQHKVEILNKTGSVPEVSMFPVIGRTNSPTQYDMALQPSHLTPSVIEQFFTPDCPALMAKKTPVKDDQPLDMKAIPEKSKDCPWKDHPEPHLHCILKGCEAVTPNNILDISAHIRMHGYNRDVYAATIGAAPSPTASSSNPMQITTIDGFFNRKRGRPPKNRFVEVYKNAQQSPQAIFTSFKLEKQTTGKENLEAAAATGQQLCFDTSNPFAVQQQKQQKQQKEEVPSSQELPLSPPPTSSQFLIYNQNEKCGITDATCPLTMQQHYHCSSAADCTFVTMERDLLRSHLERQHSATSFADAISKKFKRFDRNIGLDCGIFECRLRKTRPHLHCRQCYRQISPFDLESHVCGETTTEQRPTLSNSPAKKKSAVSTYYSTELPNNEQQSSPAAVGGDKIVIRDYSRLPSVTFSTLNELRRKVSEIDPEVSPGTKRSHEDEKVLVVRAAGTYFPENTSDLSKTPSPAQQSLPGTAESQPTPPVIPSNAAYCSTPYCKKSRRPHDHCDTCDQAFVDPVKWRAHRLKHLQAINQPIPFHLSNFLEPEESKPTSYHKSPASFNDEQPQDLSLSPNTTIKPGAVLDERMKLYRESFPASPPATLSPQLNPTQQMLNYFPQDLMSSASIQNFHLAQLATLYQQNPYYYQHLYPFLSNTVALSRHQQQNRTTAQTYRITSNEDKPSYLSSPSESLKSQSVSSVIPGLHPGSSKNFQFLNPLLMVRPPIEPQPQSKSSQINSSNITAGLIPSPPKFGVTKAHKRKLPNGNEEFSTLIDALLPSTKKQIQFATGLAAPFATNDTSPIQHGGPSSCTRSAHDQHAQHFKIRDEQIPNGYLKFRFNEDCFFPKCGYRNHQSHFHCDRNDCHYSFCDKTRFVQHTARHERLDKLMGNDFRQFRANMSCGYENCPYYKNLGSANKSSHFHCLKCEFICSDTNKVVAHRRQHNKMEYIRMAGFRKVTNSEKCDSTFEATVPTNGNELPGTVECSYSQKQTHYHCLVCDFSVLSKAQLASHKHKT